MYVILTIVAIILLTILIVWVIDKFVPKKVKPIITLLLWGLIFYLGYITFMSVYSEIQFNKLKDKRYATVVERLQDVRDAQLSYKRVTGKYTDNFDNLVRFIDTAEVAITQRRDTTVLDVERTRLFGGVETFKAEVIVDTVGYYSVKDSLFKGRNYKDLALVGVGKEGAKFELKAGELDEIPVFEASVDKAVILYDQDKNLVEKEKQVVSVDGVNGPTIVVGSMNEIKTTGNWPKNFSNKE
ncbi:hypothetical protein Q2T40_11650 [Winogradskyella maritima]|uniref:Uncharacterized protein n=1 Tax=Winogradskyella maritima TaxID=1517766 RepID=A0ABV8AHY0_9FLAO|nr:hypothetical protein [Winogradskyella maritima]